MVEKICVSGGEHAGGLKELLPTVPLGWNSGQVWCLLFIESFAFSAGLLWIKGLCLSICAESLLSSLLSPCN